MTAEYPTLSRSLLYFAAALGLTLAVFYAGNVIGLSFAWIWLLIAVIFCALCFVLRGRLRSAALSTASMLVALAILEGFIVATIPSPDHFSLWEDVRYEGDYGEQYFHVDPKLGYAARGAGSYRSTKWKADKLIYDIAYSIDNAGGRDTVGGGPDAGSLVFFGGSFVFGEGLNDAETLPHFVSSELGFEFNILNLSFHGWGAHQMLRMVETEHLNERLIGDLIGAVYVGIADHVQRLSGMRSWDDRGPSYQLTHSGVVEYAGPLKPGPARQTARLLMRSEILKRVYVFVTKRARVKRYVAVVRQSHRMLCKKYGVPLTVLFWDDIGTTAIMHELREHGISIVRVSEALPRASWRDFRILGDNHPSAQANRLIARLLAPRLASSKLRVCGQEESTEAFD